jgi:acetyl esterase/lipase
MNAPRLGIDRGRVIARGGSSGATIAALAAYNTTFEPDGEDASISCEPNALVLVNPAFGFPDRSRLTPEQAQAAEGPIGAFITGWKVTADGPPAILFFGAEDPLQEKARDFARQLVGAGTRTEFYTAEGQRLVFSIAATTRLGTPSCSGRPICSWLRSVTSRAIPPSQSLPTPRSLYSGRASDRRYQIA